MSVLGPSYLPWTSWELLRIGSINLRGAEHNPELRGTLDEITLSRDEQYRMTAPAHGVREPGWVGESGAPVAGSQRPALTVIARDGHINRYELAHCLPAEESDESTVDRGQVVSTWRINLRPWQVTKTMRGEFTASWLTDWFINGPHDHFIYARDLSWSVHREYCREIQGETAGRPFTR